MKQMRRFMNFRAVTTSIAVGVISAIALSGCSSTDETRPIRLAGIPLEDTQNVADSYAILMEIISDATGREVEFYQSPDYTSGTEALLAGQVDIAQISSFSYVMATHAVSRLRYLGSQPATLTMSRDTSHMELSRAATPKSIPWRT